MQNRIGQDKLQSESVIHLITLGAGLLNLALLPLWRLPIPAGISRGIGWPLFAAGLILNLLSMLALKGGGRIEPVARLVTGGIYAWERHPMYSSFVLLALGLDIALGSLSGGLGTLAIFLPILVWRARLEERALERRFGDSWIAYAQKVPSLLLGGCRSSGA